MILESYRRLKRAGLLGMNRRNADYILRLNPRSLFPLVDDKIQTKKLAEAHGIPAPPLYAVISRQGEVAGFEKARGENRQFAVKPARGSGGSGILLIQEVTAEGYVNQSGRVLSRRDFFYHVSDILSGVYSLSGLEDRAVIEALIHPDSTFEPVTFEGVPDIRIIVYRGVPVMAMVRLPTRASDGKANLHRGAIGAGICLGEGVTGTAVFRSEVINRHPDTGNPVGGIRIPGWGKMLEMAARCWEMTGLGYMGVDLVLDRDRGPLLLELNARPGLAIQLANRRGLKERLDRIDGAPGEIFATAESRVEWARRQFR